MFESSSDWPTREWIERAVINQHDGLKRKSCAARSKAMLAGCGSGHKSNLPSLSYMPTYRSHGSRVQRIRRQTINGFSTGTTVGAAVAATTSGGSKSRTRSARGGYDNDEVYKLIIRAGYYF